MHSVNKKNSEILPVNFKIIGPFLFILFISISAQAQLKDSVNVKQEKDYKNVLKLNLTSWILYINGVQINYERILSPKRSITVFGGPIQFPMPSVIDNSSLNFDKNNKRSGFVVGAEYRFYLAKENKYKVPHGVYLAPFVSYYHFTNERAGRDTLNPQNNLTLNTTLNFLNIGAELGYQFVIKKRFVVDCVMFGPALSSYNFNVKLNGSTGTNHDEQVQAVIDAIKQKFPLLKDISSDEGFSKSGISNFWSLGFRYAIHIGYRC